MEDGKPYYQFCASKSLIALNSGLIQAYDQLKVSNKLRKTHYFAGRYENIYIDRWQLPEIQSLIDFWLNRASVVLDKPIHTLRCGFWFNDMQPGDVTLPHSHDDDDELLSGVYYLKVPENSGNLILHEGSEQIVVAPEEGKLVLFSSSNVHEVSENKSGKSRLSIGINFGRAR